MLELTLTEEAALPQHHPAAAVVALRNVLALALPQHRPAAAVAARGTVRSVLVIAIRDEGEPRMQNCASGPRRVPHPRSGAPRAGGEGPGARRSKLKQIAP